MKKILLICLLLLISSGLAEAKDCIPGRQFELIINGDFEMGDTLFATEYKLNPRGKNERTYSVTDNPFLSYAKFDSCGDHTSGFGKMMIINGDTLPGTLVWKQTVRNLKKGLAYELNFWHTPINKLRAPILIVMINNDTLNPNPIFMPDSSCNWQRATSLWNSGISDTAEIRIYDAATHIAGNDFALDDISFMEYCRIQACTGNDLNVCKDKTVQLSGSAMDGYEPYTYSWFPPIGLDNPNIQNPLATPGQTSKYILTVTDINGCSSTDTVTLNVYDGPDNSITADKPLPACPCETVTLSAKPGYSYLWSTGEITQSIIVSEPREYSVIVTDKYGCVATNTFAVEHLPVSLTIGIDSAATESGKPVVVRMKLLNETNFFDCGYTQFKSEIRYNPTLIKPTGKYLSKSQGKFETISVNEDFKVPEEIELNFTAALGNDTCTDIEISSFTPDCDSVSVIFTNGQICITDICYEGGPRLIDMTKSVFLEKISNEGNSVTLNFGTIENENTDISVYDYSGKYCRQIINGKLKPGEYETEFDISTLSDGLYFLVMKSGGSVITQSFFK